MPFKYISFLRNFPLFKELSDTDIVSICSAMHEEVYPTDTVLIKQGEPADAVYFLYDGAVKILVNDEMVAMIDGEQCFGEMSCLIPNTMASASVATLRESQFLKIEKSAFLSSIKEVPMLWRSLFLQMANRVQSVNGRLSEVLHHSPQGLVKVDINGVISKDYSIQCTKYFNCNSLAGLKFQDLLFEDSDSRKKDWFDYFQLMFSNHMMTFEDISQLLLSEITLNKTNEDRIYKLSYFPCFDDSDEVVAVDIGMEDITLQRELELINEQMEQEQAILGKVYESPDTFLGLLELLRASVREIEGILGSDDFDKKLADESRYIMRKLHNAKGLSGLFEMSFLKESCHHLESLVSHFKGVDEEFKESFGLFKSSFSRAESILDEINQELKRRLLGVCFDREMYEDLVDHLNCGRLKEAIKIVDHADSVEALKLFEMWPEQVERISQDLGKSVMIKTSGDNVQIKKQVYAELDSCLIHLLRNSLDHGLEEDDERGAIGKSVPGKIEVKVLKVDGGFCIEVGDDGRGIDSKKIRSRAESMNLCSKTELDKLDGKDEMWRVLFLPGFSSKEEVTDLSGRGVGLDSIQAIVKKYKGSISVHTNLGVGTTFKIFIPV